VATRLRARRRIGLLALAVIAAAPAAASALWKAPPVLVWNASASVAVGLYAVLHDRPVRTGDVVVAGIPRRASPLAASRRYIPADVPLVKRIAAGRLDRVCARGPNIWVNGLPVAVRLRLDRAGRPMPWWSGCRTLGKGQILLLGDSPSSFDGRYFGISSTEDLVGRAKLLWAP
jgi:conjugative transfer signal peptidase TraF